MLGQPFINPSLSKAIEDYLKYKDNPSDEHNFDYLVSIVRTLIYIYGELDIINPYITQNEHSMGGFDNNIVKFGFPSDLLEDFKNSFVTYDQEVANNAKPNVSFTKLQKYMIDMFFYKKRSLNLPDSTLEEIKKFLYIRENQEVHYAKLRDICLTDFDEIDLYFRSKQYEFMHNFNLSVVTRETLISDAYILMGYQMSQINSLNDYDLKRVNDQIYKKFQVDPNASNKDELLFKAVNYYKKYGNKLTTGNGFVDFLLILSVISTALFVGLLCVLNII